MSSNSTKSVLKYFCSATDTSVVDICRFHFHSRCNACEVLLMCVQENYKCLHKFYPYQVILEFFLFVFRFTIVAIQLQGNEENMFHNSVSKILNCAGCKCPEKLICRKGKANICSIRTLTSKTDWKRTAAEDHEQRVRKNALNIQMLSERLYTQIFKQPVSDVPKFTENDISRIKQHLDKFNLWNKQTTQLPEVNFKLPEIEGIFYARIQSMPNVRYSRCMSFHLSTGQ